MIKIKAQSAIEFMIIVGAVLFFFLAFVYALQVQRSEDIMEKRNLEVKEVALTVKDEINLANEASDGYSRNFVIPNMISGVVNYNITINGVSLYIYTIDGPKIAMAFPILNTTGQPKLGSNLIRKSNGSIYLN